MSGGGGAPAVNAVTPGSDEVDMTTLVNQFMAKQKRDEDAEFYMVKLFKFGGANLTVPHWYCNGCNLPFSGGKARVRAHVGGFVGQGIHPCKNAVDDDQKRCVEIQQKFEAEKRKKEAHAAATKAAAAAAKAASAKKRQSSLEESLGEFSRQDLDNQWAKAFYKNGLSFRTADDCEFRKAVKMTSQLYSRSGKGDDKPAYANPERHRIGGSLLVGVDVKLSEEVATSMAHDYQMFGATYLSDGWSSGPGSIPMVNSLIDTPAASRFLNATDTTGQSKTKEYIFGVFQKDMAMLTEDERKATDFACMDGAEQSVLAMIEAAYPWMSASICAPHTVSNLGKDFAAEPFIADVLKQCREIISFMKAHQHSRALWKKHGGKTLKMPGETRFIYQFIVAMALKSERGTARKVVVDDETDPEKTIGWEPWLRGKDYRDAAKIVGQRILSAEFWDKLDLVCEIGEPLLATCRLFDKSDPIMGHIYGQMLKLDTTIENVDGLDEIDGGLRENLREVIEMGKNEREGRVSLDEILRARHLEFSSANQDIHGAFCCVCLCACVWCPL